MKLCFISNLFPRPDEPQRGLFNLQVVEALARKVNVSVVVPMPGKKKDLAAEDIEPPGNYPVRYLPVKHIPFIGRNWAASFHQQALITVREEIERSDAILASWLYPDGVAAVRVAAGIGKPVWIQVLGSDILHLQSRYRRGVIRDACNRSAGVICVARHLADALAEAGVDREKLHVVHNGVDAALFKPAGMVARNNEVLWVGNMVAVKNPEAMLEAFARLKSMEHRAESIEQKAEEARGQKLEDRAEVRGRISDLRSPTSSLNPPATLCAALRAGSQASSLALVFIGDGPMRRSIEHRAESMGLRGMVEFTGSLPHEKVAERMARARVLCLTSKSEGMPNVVLEAMASGLPVVSTPVGAVPEMVEGEPLAATADDAEGLAREINRMLGVSEQDRMAMSRRHSLRTWDTVATDILELMK